MAMRSLLLACCLGAIIFGTACMADATNGLLGKRPKHVASHAPGPRKARPTATPTLTYSGFRPNIALVILDDARPDTPAYGVSIAQTPNINAYLSNPRTAFFTKAFANYPECGPSRSSFLMGRSPFITGVLNNQPVNMRAAPGHAGWQSLPGLFKSWGYLTWTGGKVFHPGIEDPQSWSYQYAPNLNQYGRTGDLCSFDKFATAFTAMNEFVGCITSSFKYLPDALTTNAALAQLDRYAASNQTSPFFLAVGLYKPHTPLHVHKQFIQMYNHGRFPYANQDLQSPLIQPQHSLPMPYYSVMPSFFPPTSGFYSPLTTVTSSNFRISTRSAYLASLSQSDYFIGLLTNKLHHHGLDNSTMVVITADHGIFLSEHHIWGKVSAYDTANRVPLLFHIPWLNPPDPSVSSATRIDLVWEQLNLYRTLAGLAGLANNVQKDVEGQDLSLEIANAVNQAPFSTPGALQLGSIEAAFTQVLSCPMHNEELAECSNAGLVSDAIGQIFSIRTPEWRYSVYVASNGSRPDWTRIVTQELYAHADDTPPLLQDEALNMANSNSSLCATLFARVKARFFVGT